MKNISFLYSLIIMLSLAFGSCSRKYGCYYSNFESTEILNKRQVNENDHQTNDLELKETECVLTCH